MGRAPCCDKANVKKGPWSPEEDAKLKSYIEQHGTGGNWIALPQKIGLKRCGKSCRLRWLNYLRPNIKHGGFSEEEDNIICSLYVNIGSRWSVIAAQLPGRTDNDIKNYWNTRLKKKLLGKQRKEQQARIRGNKQQVINRGTRGHSISVIPENSTADQHQQPYWPQMPVLAQLPYSNNQEPCFNDHDSITKLIIKLEGRFSDDDYYEPTYNIDGLNLAQFPADSTANASTQHFYEEEVNNIASSAPCMNNASSNNQQVQFAQNHYCAGVEGLEYFAQGKSSTFSSSPLLEELVSNTNYPQRLDGLEFFYGARQKTSPTTCGQIGTGWGEIHSDSLVYPPDLVANSNYYEGIMQTQTPQAYAFEDQLRYPAGAQ